MDSRLDVNDLKRSRVRCVFDDADRQPLWENAIFAGREDDFAGVDFLVVRHIVHHGQGVASALHDAVGARIGEEGADAAIAVVDEKHLRRVIRENFDDFAHDAFRRDDRPYRGADGRASRD